MPEGASDKREDARRAIGLVVRTYWELRREGRVEALVSLFTPRGTAQHPDGRKGAGASKLLRAYEPIRNARGLECTGTIVDVQLDADDRARALASCTGTVLDTRTEEVSPAAWNEAYTLKRVNDTWLIDSYAVILRDTPDG